MRQGQVKQPPAHTLSSIPTGPSQMLTIQFFFNQNEEWSVFKTDLEWQVGLQNVGYLCPRIWDSYLLEAFIIST